MLLPNKARYSNRAADCAAHGNGGNILKWSRILTTPSELFASPMTEMLLLAGSPVSLAAEILALKLIVGKLVSGFLIVAR